MVSGEELEYPMPLIDDYVNFLVPLLCQLTKWHLCFIIHSAESKGHATNGFF